mmetsp:Transcript_13680/g.35146  ORF Transcript_13680/g.35146 Transcript_13680/m.35146 type:complete len:275 (-) Transcript_13680:70-894(-)
MLRRQLRDVHRHYCGQRADPDAANDTPRQQHRHAGRACLHDGADSEHQRGDGDGGAAAQPVREQPRGRGAQQPPHRQQRVDERHLTQHVLRLAAALRHGHRPAKVPPEARHHEAAAAAADVVPKHQAAQGRDERHQVHGRPHVQRRGRPPRGRLVLCLEAAGRQRLPGCAGLVPIPPGPGGGWRRSGAATAAQQLRRSRDRRRLHQLDRRRVVALPVSVRHIARERPPYGLRARIRAATCGTSVRPTGPGVLPLQGYGPPLPAPPSHSHCPTFV